MNAKLATALDPDLQEIAEWIEAFDEIIDQDGPSKGTRVLEALTQRAREAGVDVPVQLNTPYINTIPVEEEVPYAGDRALERRIESLMRWNAMAMVHRQNKKDPGHRRPYFHLFIAGHAAGSGLQSLLPRQIWRPARRFCLFSGPRLTRCLCPRLSRRAAFQKSNLKISATNFAILPACRRIRIPG